MKPFTSSFLPSPTHSHLVSRPFFLVLCPDLSGVYGNHISQLPLSQTNWAYYIISALVPRKPRSISKSSLLNLADTRVGKSLNKNKFVDVLGQETQRTDKMFHEPTLPSASAFTLFSAHSLCSILQKEPTSRLSWLGQMPFPKGRDNCGENAYWQKSTLWYTHKTPYQQKECQKVLTTNTTLRLHLYFQSTSTSSFLLATNHLSPRVHKEGSSCLCYSEQEHDKT